MKNFNYFNYTKTIAILLQIVMIATVSAKAVEKKELLNTVNKKCIGFIQNKGQVRDQYGELNSQALFLLNASNLNVQLHSVGFSYDAYVKVESGNKDIKTDPIFYSSSEIPKNHNTTYKFHRVDVSFVGANQNCEIQSTNKITGSDNLYIATTSLKEYENVVSFKTVVIKNIYNGIDLEFNAYPALDKPFEYNFIIHEGADATQIKIKYNGALSSTLINNKISLKTIFGNIVENIPSSYLENSKVNLNVSYRQINSNTYGFNIPTYNKSKKLIIDPTPMLTWGSYFGDFGDERGMAMTLDAARNVYIAGYTNSIANIATSGTHQSSFNGGNEDVFVAMFDNTGNKVWCTYFGGPQDERAMGIALDFNGDVYITGHTNSQLLSTIGVHQVGLSGIIDAFLAKFKPNGILIWSTYFGGTSVEQGRGIAINDDGNVMIVGDTGSSNGIATPGAHQSVYGGIWDGYIAVFNPIGRIEWATYYGGSDVDGCRGVSFDEKGNAYIIGWTGSINNIATSGQHQATYGGGTWDAFVTKFSQTGARVWGVFYGGSGEDWGNAIVHDKNGSFYIGGNTWSNNNISTINAAQPSFAGGSKDCFIAKFNNNAGRQWGTYLGGYSEELATGIAVDVNGNVCLTGYTQSANGISTQGSFQPNFAGNKDAFISLYSTRGVRMWGTYYGGANEEYSSAICMDNEGNVLITGSTSSNAGISSGNTYQTSITNGPGIDMFVGTITCSLPALTGSITSLVQVCKGSEETFTLPPVTGVTDYNWSFPSDWTILSGGFTNSVLVRVGSIIGDIKVNTSNSCGFGKHLIARLNVDSIPSKTLNISGKTMVCMGSILDYQVSPYTAGMPLVWSMPVGWTGSNSNNTLSVISSTTGGAISVNTFNQCGNGPTFTINVAVSAPIPTPYIIQNNSAMVSSANAGNQWYLNNMEIVGATNKTYTPTINGQYSVIVTDANGCLSLQSQVYSFTTVGFAQTATDAGIALYPNPTNSASNLIIKDFSGNQDSYFAVLDLTGKIISKQKLFASNEINSDLPSGMYIVEVMNNNKQTLIKYIKQ